MKIGTEGTVLLGNSGIETYTREVVKALASRYIHDTHIVIGLKRRKEAVASILNTPSIEIRNTLVHDLLLGEALRPVAKVIQQKQWSSSLKNLDIVHFMSHFRFFTTGVKSVVTVHDLFPLDTTLDISPGMRSDFLHAIHKHISQAVAFLTPSEWVRNALIEFSPSIESRVYVTPLAAGKPFDVVDIDWEVLKPLGITTEEKPFVFVGRVDQRKNIGRILEAYSALPLSYQQNHPLVLCCSGTGKEIQEFQKKYSTVLASPHVHLHLYLPTHTIVHILNAAYALVFPSTMEGFGLPVLEAMRCGCPVITSNVTSLPEVGGTAALYVNPLDTDSLVTQLKYIVEHPGVQQEMVQKSLTQATKFSWDQTAQLTHAVYEQLI